MADAMASSASPRLVDQFRSKMRTLHYSLRTEETYWHWIKRFILFSGKRHPRGLGAPEVEAFLSSLALDRKVSASTQNLALAAVLFLYREVLEIDLPRLQNVSRAKKPTRLPTVLSSAEVFALLDDLGGQKPAPLLVGSCTAPACVSWKACGCA